MPWRPHTGEVVTDAWANAARRLRTLQLAQLGAVVLIAVVAALAASLAARELGRVSDGRDRAESAVTLLAAARDDLRAAQARFFRAKAIDPRRKGLTPQVVFSVSSAGERLRRLSGEQDAWAPEAARTAGAASVASLQELVRLTTANLTTRPGSAADRRALTDLDSVSERLDTATGTWLRELQAVRDRETARLDALRAGMARRVAIVAALLAAAAVFLWLILDRARARVVAALRAGAEEQHAQRRLATAVAEGADLPAIAEVAVREAHALLDARGAAVAVADHGIPVVLAASGETSPTLQAAMARAVATGEPTRMDTAPGRRRGDAGDGAPPCIAVPVVVDGSRWGAIGAQLPVAGGRPDDHERLTRVAGTLALAAGAVEARRRLTHQATSDALTGLANHRTFRDRLAEEMLAARADGRELALALIDIDHFKAVNDGMGHQAGDGVLAEVARRIRAEARDEDVVARVGGEEFAWLMPGADGMEAFAAAERARLAVRGSRVQDVPLVTVSAGVATVGDTDSPDELMRLADAALYWSKANGRDLCCRWSADLEPERADGTGDTELARLKALSAIQALARAVDARDPYTLRHSERVAELTHRLALAAGWAPARAVLLREAALLHDVGKVGVPDAVLLKPAPLTDDEFDRVREHAALGAQIVAGVLHPEQVGWVRAHHERFDGAGYPDGASGTCIPDGARLMAVADAYDAMTTDRPYRRACDPAAAVAACLVEAGGQLCPDAVELLHGLWRAGRLPPARVVTTA